MEFKEFKKAIQLQFQEMNKHHLFKVSIDKDLLWQTYLESFPEGTNPIFRERTEHDCSCCKSFIRAVGDLVTIIDDKLVSIWDIELGGYYQEVSDAMSKLIKQSQIENIFLHPEKTAGTDKNRELLSSGDVRTWEHFFIQIPAANYCQGINIGTKLSESRSTYDVMYRGLNEITLDAIDTVLELIAQNSLYRGEENLFVLQKFRDLKKNFDNAINKELFCWNMVYDNALSITRIRNTSIGTLLTDISEGIDLERAVKSFEFKVAPTNYKRPTALVTKSMVEKAQKDLEELGLTSALDRRYAVLEDITINNVLFADRSAKKIMNVFDEIVTKPTSKKSFDKVESVDIETFVKEILPKASSIELMVENKHMSNFVSLIAPASESKTMFKWHNNFSWSYAGEVTDSIKERVKKAGGRIDGYARFSLSWSNFDDLDLHMIEANNYEIFYANRDKRSPCGGKLDVDMNAGFGHTREPVENIVYAEKKTMKYGNYRLYVYQFSKRETIDTGFEVEMEVDGVINTFVYDKPLKDREVVTVLSFTYDKDGIKITDSLPSTQSTKRVWNVDTQQFHKVNVVMFSPNHWDEKATGNKHYFFMLDNCKNDGTSRGFYNEFLSQDLTIHRKVFEILGSKMKVEPSNNQLSGLGFSSTQRNEVFCRVTGSFSRTIKIIF